jgi:hypothetical protein
MKQKAITVKNQVFFSKCIKRLHYCFNKIPNPDAYGILLGNMRNVIETKNNHSDLK